MYTNDDIQKMLEKANKEGAKFVTFLSQRVNSSRDYANIRDVLNECYYERFDRYDSDICEQFITIYEEYFRNQEIIVLEDVIYRSKTAILEEMPYLEDDLENCKEYDLKSLVKALIEAGYLASLWSRKI